MFGSDALSELTKWKVFQLSWLGDRFLSFYSVLFVSIWQSIGFYTVIYIRRPSVDPQRHPGSRHHRRRRTVMRFLRVTLPHAHAVGDQLLLLFLISSVRVFDVIVSLTGAGPGRATASVTFDIYTEAFTNNRYGYATAKTLLLFVVVLFISIVQVRAFKNREVEV